MVREVASSRGRWRAAVEVSLAGWVLCALYASAASSIGPGALLRLPYWLTALGDVGVGVILALLVVELRRALIAAALAAGAAAVFYWLLLAAPALVAPDFAARLTNHASIQMVPVFFLSLFLALIGALVGTLVNTAARGYEL